MGEKNLQLNGMMAIHKDEVFAMCPEEIADIFISDNNYRKQVFGPPRKNREERRKGEEGKGERGGGEGEERKYSI